MNGRIDFRAGSATLLLSVAMALVGASTASAQTYPSRPVKVVVPYPPGGTLDPLVRVITRALSQKNGQPYVIENRPGAATLVGAQAVLQEPRDGHALFTPGSSVTTWKIFNKDATIDLKRDFEPITQLYTSSLLLVTNTQIPARTFEEFVAYAKANPGKLNYGSPGGGALMLRTEQIKRLAGIDLVHVPYKGGADMRPPLLENQIQLLLDNDIFHINGVRSGKLRILAVTSKQRIPQLPDVPTLEEVGFRGVSFGSWSGLFVGSGTPKAIVDRIYADVAEVLKGDEYRSLLAKVQFGNFPGGQPPAEWAREVEAEAKTYSDVAEAIRLK